MKKLLFALLIGSMATMMVESMRTQSPEVESFMNAAAMMNEAEKPLEPFFESKDMKLRERANDQREALKVVEVLLVEKDAGYKEIYDIALDEIARIKEGKAPDVAALKKQRTKIKEFTESKDYNALAAKHNVLTSQLIDSFFPITIEPKVGAGV